MLFEYLKSLSKINSNIDNQNKYQYIKAAIIDISGGCVLILTPGTTGNKTNRDNQYINTTREITIYDDRNTYHDLKRLNYIDIYSFNSIQDTEKTLKNKYR